MEKVAVIYGSTTGNTESVAQSIRELLGEDRADLINVASAGVEDFNRYRNLILGASTWGLGELQDDWDGKLALLKSADLKGKQIALFGLGDQQSYSETFLDGMGTLYETLLSCGVMPIGQWPSEGYSFGASTACVDGNFVGLALDEDTEPDKTEGRIKTWLKQLDTQWL